MEDHAADTETEWYPRLICWCVLLRKKNLDEHDLLYLQRLELLVSRLYWMFIIPQGQPSVVHVSPLCHPLCHSYVTLLVPLCHPCVVHVPPFSSMCHPCDMVLMKGFFFPLCRACSTSGQGGSCMCHHDQHLRVCQALLPQAQCSPTDAFWKCQVVQTQDSNNMAYGPPSTYDNYLQLPSQ